MTTTQEVAARPNTPGPEVRSYDLEDVELRDNGDKGFTFEGVAAVVDRPYTVRDVYGEYTETIRSGAFNKTLKDGSAYVGLYVNHGHKWGQVPLATRGAGTLRITADPDLKFFAELDRDRPDVQIIASAVRRGEMRQMSVGFNKVPARDKWNADSSEVVRHEVQLFEASITEKGCSPTTTAAIRSFDEFMQSLTDIDMGEDEIRRAIAAFEARLAPVEEDEEAVRALAAQAAEIAERDRADLERLERLRLLRV